jgi:hypothetical protein
MKSYDKNGNEIIGAATYRIVRFYQSGSRPKTIKRGMTLALAQEHCNNPKTRGKGWFDGYEMEA